MFQFSARKARGFAIVAAASIALTACGSPVPLPVSYPLTLQDKMQSAAHWQMVAADMWQEVSVKLQQAGFDEKQIALEPPAKKTTFTTAMDNFLFTEAVQHGVAVTPDASFTLTYDVQVIHYASDRDGPATPGLITGIAGAGALAGAGYEHGWGAGSAAAAGVPIAAAADFVDGWMPSDSSTELVLTVSVVQADTVRIRESKVFYISDGDAKLYEGGGRDTSARGVNNSEIVDSNWYASEPRKVVPIALRDQNRFNIIVDEKNGPVHNVNAATVAAGEHCGTQGMSTAKYISQGYPSNDRSTLTVTFECQ